ncbi:MAG: fused MFS/spermidine synthase [Deltaproteobacteria bacterium]|nr:fused MFS/spermidine synthase [Deltaproteobacteria bacterium]
MPPKLSLQVLYLAFTLSGFSGLIYESIWSRYLGLLLGHAAYAQTLVLAIFMGGMAVGSWVCGRWSVGWSNLLRSYALIEAVIGLLALLFHQAFRSFLSFFFDSITPFTGSVAIVTAIKWGSAALLILPQSILLGMTFPLMSGGVMRRYPDRPGGTLATLYFCNSIGGVVGVLVSGFILIRLLGLPGTVQSAGAINVALAVIVWFLARAPERALTLTKAEQQKNNENRLRSALLLLVAMLTGTASFIYEIGWIRMLSMVLGSSTHSFEIMLSAFILGLALGGLWIRSRIDTIPDPVRFLAWVQVIMGILALSTLAIYGSTFNVMQWLIKALPITNLGYLWFTLSSHGIAMAVMLPTTFCAGMTLPVITYVLLRKGFGESSIGMVYSANTVGAIVGVFFAVHFGMPILGLRNLIVAGASTDIALGLLLFAMLHRAGGWQLPFIPSAAGIIAIVITVASVQLDAYRMASGVFRRVQRRLDSGSGDLVLSHTDGKTATVDMVWQGTGLSIRTNGKIDASINRDPGGPPTADEGTMVLSGALPILLHPEAKTAANIGIGSGLTSQILLTTKVLRQVDTVEIEPVMVSAARDFRPRNELVFSDPRSRVYIEDAKTFFSTYQRKYDIVVSEPSNPWVSGVAGLFSSEFYELISRHLNEDGVLVQWLQIYEIDLPLVASVLKALSPRFVDYQVYAANAGDILIVAKKGGGVPRPDSRILKDNPKLAAELRRVGIAGIQDLEIRKIGSKRLLEHWLASLSVPANSDYYPRLDVDAERTRFLESNAHTLLFLRQVPLPVLDMFEGSGSSETPTKFTANAALGFTRRAFAATLIRDHLLGRVTPEALAAVSDIQREVRKVLDECTLRPVVNKTRTLFRFGLNVIPYLQPVETDALWRRLGSLPCASDLREEEQRWLNLFMAVGRRDAPAMGRVADDLLDRGVPPEFTVYLVTTSMLAHRVQGNYSRVHELWRGYRDRQFGADWLLLLDILAAGAAPQSRSTAH